MKVVYVAGKFRGKSAWDIAENVRAAERVGLEVARAGAMPLIPHANTAHFHGEGEDQFWLDGTLELLRRSDAVMLVNDWGESEGARDEVRLAREMGMTVFHPGEYGALAVWLAKAGDP